MWHYYYGMDYTYLIFVLPAIILSLIAQFKIKSAYNTYSDIFSQRGMTGRDAALAVLRINGVDAVPIERIGGTLTDNYDPAGNVIHLSSGVYESTSIAAIGIAAHEAGHAVQYAKGYEPIKFRNSIIGVTRIGSSFAWPLILIGLLFNFAPLMYIGIGFFALIFIFQVVTLPVEFNASTRALMALDEGQILDEYELEGAHKVLNAAAMTYVASMLVALGQLLRLLAITGRRRR